jgi:hypothetical protein
VFSGWSLAPAIPEAAATTEQHDHQDDQKDSSHSLLLTKLNRPMYDNLEGKSHGGEAGKAALAGGPGDVARLRVQRAINSEPGPVAQEFRPEPP